MTERDLDKIRRVYDRDPGSYDRACGTGISKRVLEPHRARLAALVKPGDRVLEVGIGTGRMLTHYPEGALVSGIDLSPGMLDVARRRAAEMGRRVELREMDAQHLDFPDASFDTVLFTLCLCTIPDPLQAVREGIRVCRPGGRLGFLEHVRSNLAPIALVQDLITPILVWAHHDFWNRRTPEVIRVAGVRVLSEKRWLLGVFTLITGEPAT